MSTSDEAVVVWGELLWDRFPDGDQLGGAPANVAWHLGQAGGWARLVTRVGDDEDGRRAVARLAELVDTSLVQVDPERATGEVGVHVEGGEPRYTLHPGRAWERIACTDAVKTALAEAGVLVFGTLAQRTPEGLAQWRQVAAAARSTCTRVCDLNLRPGDHDNPHHLAAVREAIDAADVLKVNDKELVALRSLLGHADPLGALRERTRIVAVTHGSDGSTLYGEGAPITIEGVRAAPGGDNVGCGDAFLAIFVLGMTMGWDLETSGRAASRYAAAVAGVRGATPTFTDEQLAELLEDP
ncbi:MAG TPA: PfkB family carbohydrate kinase [Kofleriaceae bacterium]|jgi:fructokinase|nr:PfkB family carbohydrate kinase [Kofleriaceae bacterium]